MGGSWKPRCVARSALERMSAACWQQARQLVELERRSLRRLDSPAPPAPRRERQHHLYFTHD